MTLRFNSSPQIYLEIKYSHYVGKSRAAPAGMVCWVWTGEKLFMLMSESRRELQLTVIPPTSIALLHYSEQSDAIALPG